jgi:hypothetical protein
MEALLFEAWAAIAAAVLIVLIDMIVPRVSPLGWAFERVLPGVGSVVSQPAYRLSGAVVGVALAVGLGAFAAGWGVVGWSLGSLGAALALFSAIGGFGLWSASLRRIVPRQQS